MTASFDTDFEGDFEPRADVALTRLVMACMDDSMKWFGATVSYNVPHMTLALAGEVGELANLVKKIDRGSISWDDPDVQFQVKMEITDIFIYLLNLAGLTQTNLYQAFLVKRQENQDRFGKKESPNGTV
jgi:NTP pyrophosphatase (non-canonical NTP hydrolase)